MRQIGVPPSFFALIAEQVRLVSSLYAKKAAFNVIGRRQPAIGLQRRRSGIRASAACQIRVGLGALARRSLRECGDAAGRCRVCNLGPLTFLLSPKSANCPFDDRGSKGANLSDNRTQAQAGVDAAVGQRSSSAAERYHGLDGMRGLAAVSVVIYHFNQPDPAVFAHGYLAVDFFFILSGFVIAYAYSDRLAENLSFGRFMLLRLVRLYPLVAAGIALGAGRLISALAIGDPEALPPSALGVSFVFNALMLPTPVAVRSLFPVNNPMWSLFFEVVLNAVFALFLFRWRTYGLVVLTVILAAALAYGCYLADTINIGWSRDDLPWGFVRAGFGITLGLVIHRLLRGCTRKASMAPLALSLLLVLALALPHFPTTDWMVDLAILFILAPAAVASGAVYEVPAALRRAYGTLGDLSYPLYCIHFPLISPMRYIGRKLHLGLPVVFVIYLSLVIVLSLLLIKYWDTPVRNRLNRMIRSRNSAPQQELA